MSPFFALGASLSYGVADFVGALAARRASALTVTLGMQTVGLLVLLPFLPFLPGRPSTAAIVIGAVSGAAGTAGLVIYLRAMAIGPIGVVSPLAAVSGAAVPVAWGAFVLGDELSSLQTFGVLLALVSVVVVAWVPGSAVGAADVRGVIGGLASGVLFGGFFIALDATPADSGMWPLVGARVASAIGVLLLLRLVSRPARPGAALPQILLAGTTDMGANVLFLLATRGGLLSISALLSSLYPVVALLLARRLLKERLNPVQGSGVIGALVAMSLLVAG
ncbi:MAG: EamA family transporter [Actinomycetota bacterium]|nr:EamA family transporter [Actinomycetota bacterium]